MLAADPRAPLLDCSWLHTSSKRHFLWARSLRERARERGREREIGREGERGREGGRKGGRDGVVGGGEGGADSLPARRSWDPDGRSYMQRAGWSLRFEFCGLGVRG